MRIVAILNQKGGVGKTTTAVNLGAALALAGQRVLLVDTDPQGNLSDHLGVDIDALPSSVYDVLMEGVAIEDVLVDTSTPGLAVLPASADLAAAEQELAGEMAREFRLRKALAAMAPRQFDWVLIDCPPSLGLLSLNAMAAAQELIITVQTEYFAMRGLGQLDEVVAMVREHVNPRLRILGILPTLMNPVTRLAREVVEEIRSHYGDLVFAARIRQNVRLAEAPGHQQHIFAYDPHSAGAADYRALAAEITEPRSLDEAPEPTPAVKPAAPPPPSEPAEPPRETPRGETPGEGAAPSVPATVATNGTDGAGPAGGTHA